MQVTLTDTSFELMALDNKMQVLWRDSLNGCGVACGKFKGNILAISDSGTSRRGNVNPYYAYLVDPASGKIILQKKIFDQPAKHEEEAAAFFAADGSGFTLVVRQAAINTGMVGSFKNKTEDLALISLDENLQPIYVRPKMPDENFVTMAMNRYGDFFLLTARDRKSLTARRYDHGSTEPSEPITQTCDSLEAYDLLQAFNGIVPSGTDRDILYLSIAHDNADDDREITTAKFNFGTHQAQVRNEVFTHKHVKEVEKSYVPANGDFPGVNLGTAKKQMEVRYLATHGGKLITVSSEEFTLVTNNIPTLYGFALMITCYDSDLKTVSRQLMPVQYTRESDQLTTGYSVSEDDLKIVTNDNRLSVFGQLDLSTGKWLKLVKLTADGGDSDKHIIWFDDNFIVPFMHQRSFGSKYNIDLSLYSY
jgi:hypothetical protein